MVRTNAPLPFGSAEEKRALQKRGAIWTFAAMFASFVLVNLIGPFFAMPGAEVNPYTFSMLVATGLLPGIWAEATSACAQAKGYRIPRRTILLALGVEAFVAWFLTGRVDAIGVIYKASFHGRTLVFTAEWAFVVLLTGLSGAFGPIVVAFLPDRWKTEPPLGHS